jgi:hypothetical protein
MEIEYLIAAMKSFMESGLEPDSWDHLVDAAECFKVSDANGTL